MHKHIPLIIVMVILGYLLSSQASARERIAQFASPENITSVATEVANAINANSRLREELATLKQQESELSESSTSKTASEATLNKEQEQLEIVTGQTQVTGPGVEIRFDRQIELVQIIDLLNALKNIGAEAIAVNNSRIVATTPITTQFVSPPVVITAIGDRKILADSLQRRGGILEQIGSGSTLVEKNALVLPGVTK